MHVEWGGRAAVAMESRVFFWAIARADGGESVKEWYHSGCPDVNDLTEHLAVSGMMNGKWFCTPILLLVLYPGQSWSGPLRRDAVRPVAHEGVVVAEVHASGKDSNTSFAPSGVEPVWTSPWQWEPLNRDGFAQGAIQFNLSFESSVVYRDKLYLGTWHASVLGTNTGCEVWRVRDDGGAWVCQRVSPRGFSEGTFSGNFTTTKMYVHDDGYLYVGTWASDGELLRTNCDPPTPDFDCWERVDLSGLPWSSAVTSIVGAGGYLYIGMYRSRFGSYVARAADPADPASWEQVSCFGFDENPDECLNPLIIDRCNKDATALVVYPPGSDTILVGTENFHYEEQWPPLTCLGTELWRGEGLPADPLDWSPLHTEGYGCGACMLNTSAMAVYDAGSGPKLYVGTKFNIITEVHEACWEIRECATAQLHAWDGTQWEYNVIHSPLWSGNNLSIGFNSFAVHDGSLYFTVTNHETGCEIWRWCGEMCAWERIVHNGFRYPELEGHPLRNQKANACMVFGDHLFIGAGNFPPNYGNDFMNIPGELWVAPIPGRKP